MKKTYMSLAVAAAILVGPSIVNAQAAKGVAAVVNGENIMVAEIKKAYEDNPQIKAQAKFEDFYAKALEVFVNAKIVLQEAEKSKIRDTKEYKEQVKLAQDDLARKLYMEKAALAKVSDSEVKKLYDQYKSEFKSVKEVKAKHILVDDEAKAKEIIAKIKKGEKFDELAKQHSKDQPELGYFTAELMVPEFSKAAFAMKKGAVSETPVKTQFGYHIIEVQDTRNTKPLSMKEVEGQLKIMIAQGEAAKIVESLQKSAKIEAYSADGKKL